MSAAAEKQFHDAVAALRAKRFADAERLFKAVLSSKPDHVGALNLLTVVLMSMECFADAETYVTHALQLDRSSDASFRNYGIILKSLGRPKEALAQFDSALKLNRRQSETWNDRGAVLNELKEQARALNDFDQAISLNPNYPYAFYNKGKSLGDLKRYDEAFAAYDQALALKPDLAEAWLGRGNLFAKLRRFDKAASAFDQALALKPDLAEASLNKAMLMLSLGDYKEGWRLYEWRWKSAMFTSPRRVFRQPLWLGDDSALHGKTLLLHAEQGFGDAIQFVRYLCCFKPQTHRVVLEAPAPLVRLFDGQMENIRVVARDSALPAFDLHCPLLSLPLAFGTTLQTIPASVPYLRVPAAKIARWRTLLGQRAKPRVGLAWSGQPNVRDERHVPLESLFPLLTEAVEWHSLQKGIHDRDRAAWARAPSIKDHSALLEDFSDTAALIAEMDVVISVDTAVAHLAGALGTPVWIPLWYDADFRWLRERSDSPWYPTATLFRQTVDGDWSDVITRLAAQLQSYLATAGERATDSRAL
jgi:Flp pilus assembly protein TadD